MPMSSNFKPLSITRTTNEWFILQQIVEQRNLEDLGQLLRKEVNIFLDEYSICPQCACKAGGDRMEKRPSIYTRQVKILTDISSTMGRVPVSTIVDRFVIERLLTQPLLYRELR